MVSLHFLLLLLLLPLLPLLLLPLPLFLLLRLPLPLLLLPLLALLTLLTPLFRTYSRISRSPRPTKSHSNIRPSSHVSTISRRTSTKRTCKRKNKNCQ